MKTNAWQSWVGQAGQGLFRSVGYRLRQFGEARPGGLLLRFGLGVLTSQAVILGDWAPFGVGYIAAQGSGLSALCALLGVLVGYMTQSALSNGLKYVAIALLVFTAGFVFRGTTLPHKAFFMPLAAVVASAFVGVVFVAGQGFLWQDVIFLMTELMLITGSAYFFRQVFWPHETDSEDETLSVRRTVGMLSLGAVALLSLSGLQVGGGLAPARMAAVFLVLLCAFRGGAGSGAATGVGMGLALDLGAGFPFFSMSYGLSGLMAGLFQGAGKLAASLAFVTSGAVAALWAGDEHIRLMIMLESFAASVLFFIIPESAAPKLNRILKNEQSLHPARTAKIRQYTRQRLAYTAEAFRDLSAMLTATYDQLKPDDEADVAAVFDRVSAQICRKCALSGICWDRDVIETYRMLSEVAREAEHKGRVEAGDFPRSFEGKCLHFPMLVTAAAEQYAALMYRRQYNRRIHMSRLQLTRQYGEFTQLLQHAAEEIGFEPRFDAEAEERVLHYLHGKEISAGVSVYATGSGRMCCEIEGVGLSALLTDQRKLLQELSHALGWQADEPEQTAGPAVERLRFLACEPMRAVIGVAAHKKKNASVSGDSGAYFKNDDGHLFIILSDGMGSGSEAALESGTTVRLLESFLRAGVRPETALSILNSALLLRAGENMGFSTVDLCVADLQNGDITLYKYGAAPSYIRRTGRISRVSCANLPIGLPPGDLWPAPEATRIRLKEGEWLLLVSDGVADAEDDGWLMRQMPALDQKSPREAAGEILIEAMKRNDNHDDMTALVLCLEKRTSA